MTRDEILAQISIAPNVCFGKPCIRGHRIWVSLILDFLASGWSIFEILANYPGLEEGRHPRLHRLRRGDGARAFRRDRRVTGAIHIV